MKKWLVNTICLLCILGVLSAGRPLLAYAQDGSNPGDLPEQKYYPQTGHSIGGDFLTSYESISNPEVIYGYPITEAFTDSTSGHLVQYFEHSRFERIPEPDRPQELWVHITPLGWLLHPNNHLRPGPVLTLPGCKGFPETGYQVCYAFLDFFKKNGGAAQFGYPISNIELHDGWFVQYFQMARFEWHPELPSGEKVVLAHLGKEYFDMMGEDPELLIPYRAIPGSNIPQVVLDMTVSAYTKAAVLPRSGEQTVYFIVQDQSLSPIANADITMEIKLSNGVVQRIFVPRPTDSHGMLNYSFRYDGLPRGPVIIRVEATYNGKVAKTVTSFRVWW